MQTDNAINSTGNSADMALRDINERMALKVLRKAPGNGRSTAYELAE